MPPKATDSQITNNKFVTNPVISEEKAEESKLAKLQKEQKEHAKSLFIKLEEQREVYAQSKKDYGTAKHQQSVMKNKCKMYNQGSFLFERYEEKYENSKLNTAESRKCRDTELRRLQMYTDNYVSFASASIFI